MFGFCGHIKAMENNVGFPPKVLERVKQTQFKGGWKTLEDLHDQVASMAVECTSTLEEIKKQLQV